MATRNLISSLFLCLTVVALSIQDVMTISQRGSVLAEARQTARFVRREEAQPDAAALQLDADALELQKLDAQIAAGIGHYVSADANSLVCPTTHSRVDEVHVCEKASTPLGATNQAAVELRDVHMPHGCFTQNKSVYFNELSGVCNKTNHDLCPSFQLVCMKIEDDDALTPFEKTAGGCHCATPGKATALEHELQSVAQCAVLCSSVEACDAFEVEAGFTSPGKCSIITGSCAYNETADEADLPLECYLRKEREAGASAAPEADAGATAAAATFLLGGIRVGVRDPPRETGIHADFPSFQIHKYQHLSTSGKAKKKAEKLAPVHNAGLVPPRILGVEEQVKTKSE